MTASRPRAFVELCCGTGAVSLALIGGRRVRPPATRAGAKTGYATAILRAMGLRPGDGTDLLLLADSDPSIRRLWQVLPDGRALRAVRARIREVRDEDDLRLWQRLAQAPVPEDPVEYVATWLLLQGRQAMRPVTEWTDGRWGAVRDGNVSTCNYFAEADGWGLCRRRILERLDVLLQVRQWPRVEWLLPDVAELEPRNARDAYVYMDPPYVNTIAYAHALPREAVVAVAERYRVAGAECVAVSEGEPIPIDDWHHVELTTVRGGNGRTLSRSNREWLTLSRPPTWVPAVQGSLFAEVVP